MAKQIGKERIWHPLITSDAKRHKCIYGVFSWLFWFINMKYCVWSSIYLYMYLAWISHCLCVERCRGGQQNWNPHYNNALHLNKRSKIVCENRIHSINWICKFDHFSRRLLPMRESGAARIQIWFLWINRKIR